ncbi:hypothetical protein DERP_007658 [Dermatophagoides pteronyssinus]|uniref:Uncharacterized protein n=1 Tax=Dermatophagoides pteronyssinus TaxID=6956 RepID=A0ABQ8JKC9_DERPT|nr:hypothetical protein DERP_007658 [Dermatophagoides pteronyssinus]
MNKCYNRKNITDMLLGVPYTLGLLNPWYLVKSSKDRPVFDFKKLQNQRNKSILTALDTLL